MQNRDANQAEDEDTEDELTQHRIGNHPTRLKAIATGVFVGGVGAAIGLSTAMGLSISAPFEQTSDNLTSRLLIGIFFGWCCSSPIGVASSKNKTLTALGAILSLVVASFGTYYTFSYLPS